MLKYEFTVNTGSRNEFLNITAQLNKFIRDESITHGMLTVFIPHTTAAVTVNENADPDVQSDLIFALQQVAPILKEFRHYEGNSDAHLKSSLLGCSLQIPVYDGKLDLGTWQGVYFCEFDGPRTRSVRVYIN